MQDYARLSERWSIMFGARYDFFEDKEKRSGFSFSDDNVAPRLGLIYQPVPGGSLYLNYSESFKPISLANQEDVEGEGNLAPETGVQYEVGWKQEWLDGGLLTTVALYEITKQDVAQANPDDLGPGDGRPELLNLGEVESRGIEFTLVGDITERLTMTANYAYNETEVVQGVEGDSIGNTFGGGSRFANAPEHQAGLWARYSLPSLNSALAIGADYVSEQFSLSGQRVQAFHSLRCVLDNGLESVGVSAQPAQPF
ncbi:MAG: TonB-dependent receptor [Halioglobus sp.]|nr:TonB-dependent receptor [Halioglobus sp.]